MYFGLLARSSVPLCLHLRIISILVVDRAFTYFNVFDLTFDHLIQVSFLNLDFTLFYLHLKVYSFCFQQLTLYLGTVVMLLYQNLEGNGGLRSPVT